MIVRFVFFFILCNSIIASQDKSSFGSISDDALSKIIFYADVLPFRFDLEMPGLKFTKEEKEGKLLTDSEMKKKFPRYPCVLHLVNKRFSNIVLSMRFGEIVHTGSKIDNYFLWNFVPAKLLSENAVLAEQCKKYTIGTMQTFFEYPHFSPEQFFTIDPCFNVTTEDLELYSSQSCNSGMYSAIKDGLIRKLAQKYITKYREIFQITAKSFQFNLLALLVLSCGQESDLFSENRLKEEFLYLFFLNTHLPAGMKERIYPLIEQKLYESCGESFEQFIRLLFSGNPVFKKVGLLRLSRRFEEGEDCLFSIPELYVIIFGLKEGRKLQTDLADDFATWFTKHNLSHVKEQIDAVIGKKIYHPWFLYPLIKDWVRSDTIKLFFDKYCLPFESERLRRLGLYRESQSLVTEIKLMLSDLNQKDADSFPDAIFTKDPFIPCFLKQKDRYNGIRLLDEIISYIATKTGLFDEVVAQKLGLCKFYKPHYAEKMIRGLSHKWNGTFADSLFIDNFLTLNPFYRFSDGSYFFEKFFYFEPRVSVDYVRFPLSENDIPISEGKEFSGIERNDNRLFRHLEFNERYRQIQKKFLDSLVQKAKQSEFKKLNNSLFPEQIFNMIKKVVKLDRVVELMLFSDGIIHDKYDGLDWNIRGLAPLVEITHELKTLVHADIDLMDDIKCIMHSIEQTVVDVEKKTEVLDFLKLLSKKENGSVSLNFDNSQLKIDLIQNNNNRPKNYFQRVKEKLRTIYSQQKPLIYLIALAGALVFFVKIVKTFCKGLAVSKSF